jgi:hypothetical protein
MISILITIIIYIFYACYPKSNQMGCQPHKPYEQWAGAIFDLSVSRKIAPFTTRPYPANCQRATSGNPFSDIPYIKLIPARAYRRQKRPLPGESDAVAPG